MTEAIALESTPPVGLLARLARLLPGIALLFVIGYAGKVTEQVLRNYGTVHHLAPPNIEYVLWAILFGLIIANTVGIAQVFRPGIATYEVWLKSGIVLLGARFLLGDWDPRSAASRRSSRRRARSRRTTRTPPSPSRRSLRWARSASSPIWCWAGSCT